MLGSAACGPPPAPPERPSSRPDTASPQVTWPQSPMAPLARDLFRTAEAALAGDEAAVERVRVREATGPRVDDAAGRPKAGLEPLGMLARVDVQVGESWVAVAWWLDDEDARVIQLERRDAPVGSVSAPEELAGAARQAFDALRGGRLRVREPDAAVLGAPPAPSEAELERLRELAASADVGEMRVDDVALLARDGAGDTWLLELAIVEVTTDGIVLSGDPLLTVVPAAD